MRGSVPPLLTASAVSASLPSSRGFCVSLLRDTPLGSGETKVCGAGKDFYFRFVYLRLVLEPSSLVVAGESMWLYAYLIYS